METSNSGVRSIVSLPPGSRNIIGSNSVRTGWRALLRFTRNACLADCPLGSVAVTSTVMKSLAVHALAAKDFQIPAINRVDTPSRLPLRSTTLVAKPSSSGLSSLKQALSGKIAVSPGFTVCSTESLGTHRTSEVDSAPRTG